MVRVISLRIIKGLLALSIFFLLAIPWGAAARSQPFAGVHLRTLTDAATTDGVDLAVGGVDGDLVPSGGTTRVTITVANLGMEQAGKVRLIGNIPLGVLVRSPEVLMRCAIRACHWDLGEMPYLGQGNVTLDVTLPDAPPGTAFDLRFSASSTQPDALPANNVKVVRLTVAGGGAAAPETAAPETVVKPAAPKIEVTAPGGNKVYPYFYPYIRR